MKNRILITGGAGFIGSFIADKLINDGHEVRILDNLEPQVHTRGKPNYLNSKAEFMYGDVTKEEDLKKALADVDVVFHKAAMVGVGQSMYQIKKYVEVNSLGTAMLLDKIVNGNYNIKKIIVASSMSAYGEGTYKDPDTNEIIYPELREEKQLSERKWEYSNKDGKMLIPVPTKESKPLQPNSIYAISKKNQEESVLNVCQTYGIPGVALRYFNVYGPRQSLNNPYTGVAAIFMSRLKNNNPPLIFEDGNQSRDFVSVHDIVQANMLAMKSSSANYESFNVGAGRKISIKDIADVLIKITNKNLKPEITGNFRKGDIRHCFADISKIKTKLGYEPKHEIFSGMEEIFKWSEKESAQDNTAMVTEELKKKGLLK